MRTRLHPGVLLGMCLSLLIGAIQVQARELPDFVDLAKSNTPAVVNISTQQSSDAQQQAEGGLELPDNVPLPELFRHFFKKGIPQLPDRESRSLGSGFIISKDGYILTNYHVVDGADRVEVRLSDRRTFEAKVIGGDQGSDVALIKIDAKNLPVVKIGKSSDLQVGEWVLAIGSPFGFDHTVTAGIVSAKGRSLPSENYVPFIQTDVAINPGNSGGPLFNMDGEVIGVNSQIYSRTGGFMGLSFAIPIELAMDVAQQLRENGSVKRGYLGVLIQDVDRDLAESFGLKQPGGALVSKVLPNTPAAAAGLQVGDIILSFNGRPVNRSSELPPMVGVAPVDSDATIEVIRDGKKMKMSIQVAQLPSKRTAQVMQPQIPAQADRIRVLGLTVDELTPAARKLSGLAKGGALVTEVGQGIGAASGLQAGDVIKMFDRKTVTSPQQLRDLVASAEKARSTVAALILRDGDPMFVPMRLHD